jgi:branched-chain amino acid aminotransferase
MSNEPPPPPIVWLNGALVPLDQAVISPADRGFLLADGLFETIQVTHGSPRNLPAHLRRLAVGCDVLGLAQPENIPEALIATLHANGLSEGSARITWTRGAGPRGLLPAGTERPTLLITATPATPAQTPPAPWSVITCRTTCRNERSPLSQIKSLNYGDGLLARREAAAQGANDALLLNSAGRLAESSIATAFIRRNGVWLTPPTSEGALAGIRRSLVLAAGWACESPLSQDDLAQAEALVLTSTLMAQPISHLDHRPLAAFHDAQAWAAAVRAL